MPTDQCIAAVDIALLSTASRYNLSDEADCRRSNRELVRLFDRLAKAVRPNLVLEIGAFRGEFSRRMKEALPEATIIAFEANPHNHEAFSAGFDGTGIEYRFMAVGDAVGATVMNIARIHSSVRGSHSLLLKTRENVEYDAVEVPLTTVDEVCSTLPDTSSVIMWIDVEGLGYEVLTGATRTLAETALIFLEVEDKPYWQGQKLSGEVNELLWRNDFVPVARDFIAVSQYNIIYCQRRLLSEPAVREVLTYYYGKR